MGCYPSEGARIEDLLCQRTQQVGETKGLQNENLNSVIYLQNLWFSTQFYYASGNQHVYLRNECNGLNPDDDRYSCLIHEMRLVSSNEPCFGNGQESFVNMGDQFKRFVNWKEVTSEE